MQVFVENEAGSRRKNVYDERTLQYLRTVDVSAAYPFPYGFAIGTVSGDKDAVDCFVLTTQALAAGTTIECDPIGLLEQIEDGEIDHKVIAVPRGQPATVDETAVSAIRAFVSCVFAHVPDKRMEVGRLLDRNAAEDFLRQCRE